MKAQITVFIIIGVLILAAFAVVIYVASSMAKSKIGQTGVIETQSVQDYVTSCLESVSTEGINFLGKQGGYLFNSQGGATAKANITISAYSGFDIAYDLTLPKGDFAYYYSDPPMYPYDRFPYIAGNISFTGFYGMNRLPALFKTAKQSMQGSLEQYISAGMDTCVDFSKFASFKVTQRPKTVTVLLAANKTHFEGERFFSVLLDWPMNITYSTGEKIELNNFAIKVPVRLASVYYFANELINQDISNINYEPHSAKGFDVSIEKINQDSVVKISDPMSVIADTPYEFWYARKNRAPALWYIDVGGLSSVYTGTEVSIHNDVLKIEDVCEDEEYDFPLHASDPDNDTVTFSVDASGFASAPGPGSFTVYAKDGGLVDDYQVLSFNIIQCP